MVESRPALKGSCLVRKVVKWKYPFLIGLASNEKFNNFPLNHTAGFTIFIQVFYRVFLKFNLICFLIQFVEFGEFSFLLGLSSFS